MKLSIPIVCPACGNEFDLDVSSGNLPNYSKCPKCDARPYNMWPLGNIVTLLLIERAKRELAKDDISLAILLSAIAVEGEMAYLFFKWKGIDAGKLAADQRPLDRQQWEQEWANMRSIGKRMDELCRFLTIKPFDEFAVCKKEILDAAMTGFESSASYKDFFQENLFGKRNDIAHYAKVDFQRVDGERSLSLATALLGLLRAMDSKRIQAMDVAHRKAQGSPANILHQ
jgi:hypothetical protein